MNDEEKGRERRHVPTTNDDGNGREFRHVGIPTAELLVSMGCPQEKASEMAAQLEKRARQLSEKTGRNYEEAMAHLLNLMRQGWAAKEKGL